MVKKGKTVDFIGIGSYRSATTWISNCLREHPEIRFSQKKEICFFNAKDQHYLKYKNPRYSWGLNWYLSHFKNKKKPEKAGEFSATYLYSALAAKRIKKHFPEAKLLVTLRNPTERAFSEYLHHKRLGIVMPNTSFNHAIRKNHSILQKSSYYKYLKSYLSIFPKKNVLILLHDDIKKNPEQQLKKIYKFLGLQNTDFKPPSLSKQPNKSRKSKLPMLNYALIHTEFLIMKYELSLLLRILENLNLRKFFFNFAHFTNQDKSTKPQKIDKETEKKLKKYFKKDIIKTERLINKSLKSWLS